MPHIARNRRGRWGRAIYGRVMSVARKSAGFVPISPELVPRTLFARRKFWAERFGVAPVLPTTRAEMDELGWDSCDVILVTGDALNGVPTGGVAGPDSGFSEDMTTAIASVAKLAGFTYETALFGHGPPVLVGASGMVNALAPDLG